MFVYLVRHAEGKDSKTNWQTPETPLGEAGKKQAGALRELSRLKNIDLILTSEWQRSLETAQILAERLGKPHKIIRGIGERKQHKEIYKTAFASDISKKYFQGFLNNVHDLDWKFNGDEESFRELSKRAINFKNSLVKKYIYKNLAVISHEHFLKSLISVCMLGDDFDDESYVKITHSIVLMNSGVSLVEYIEKERRWRVWYINDFSHFKFINKQS